ncbi:cytochrome P450 [Cryphonectria parasitica EP155]|uniref:Cytochrome P450 n=1 Tax=Cryphonectria parasitica (strain ATCC 38755 / EP155) TaxID=660469 RepID=A0A9P4XUK0_CRYP1|nr:cytochrome P450 [Cryphonectria parasitica EP155]KAF3761191.1 cytochrome P450 [Cryphonectria parasitica EP155]
MATSTTSSLSETLSERFLVIVAAVLACALAYLGPKIISIIRLAALPVIGTELGNEEKRRQAYLQGARKLYYAAYDNFKNGLFKGAARLTTSRNANVIVVSPKFLPELNKLPDSVVSMEAAVDDAMETKYTKIESHVPIIPHTVTGKLTPSLTRLNPTIARETAEALELEMPLREFTNWQEVNIHEKLLRIVGMVSGRIFIGPELCRSEEYLDAAINYTMDVMKAQRAVQRMRPWMRPFLANTLPEIKHLNQRLNEAQAFLKPLVDRRQKLHAEKPDSEDGPDDFLQWMLDSQDKFTDPASRNFAKVQLGLSFAAIHTTTLTATNAFYNLAAASEAVKNELKEEAVQALSENDGVFTSKCLQSMKKLDSFLRETLRMTPASMASFQRKLLQDVRLSNGQVVPKGATIEIPAVAVNNDPEIFPNPEEFDPFRFSRIREEGKAGAAALNQFVSVNQTSLTFGFGRHACPGRFFAANEIKMILANTLIRYDVRMPGDNAARWPNLEFAHMVSLNNSSTASKLSSSLD